MKKLSFFLMAMLMSIMSFAQTAETVTMNLAEGVHDGSQITWTELNGSITITQMQGTSQNGVNANYIAAPRLYKGHILSFECVDNYTITAIKINYNGTYYGNTILVGNTQTDNVVTNNTDLFTGNFATAQNGSHEITTKNVAGESKILIQNSASNSNVQLRPKSIEISYIKAATSEPTITCGDIVFKASDAKNKEVEVIGENLTEAIVATLKTGTNFAVEGTLTTTGGTLTISVTATESGEYSDVLVLTAGEIIKEVNVTATVIKMDGDGTEENPYSVADVIALANPGVKAWVEGYIVGSMNNNKLEETPTNATNIALATTADDTENIIPVQLPSGNVRTALNVVDNPSNLGAKVAIYGTLEAYFSKPGVKNVSDYEILSTVTPEPVMFTVTATAENGTVEGAGDYEEGTEATLTATPAEGYEFVNWTSGETEVSTANPFTFTVTSDTTLVANFKEVEPVKLYLNAKDWGYGDARFAAYFFDPAKWVDMTKVEGETYIYEVEVPAGYTKVIFVRMNGSTTENNWDNKWNQTGNLDIPTDGKNMFKPDGWDGKTTTWSTYTPSVKYTFTKGSTWYIDFSAITGKKGANYPKANVADIDYSANAGGTVIPVTFTADVTWAEGATFIKTEQGDWAELKFTTPTEGANCAQVAADGKSYTWTTYVPVVIYTVTATAENGTVEGAGDYEEGTEVTLTATAAEGYEFVNWTKGEEVVSTENPYTFVVTADVALVANFAVVEPEVIAYELNGGELVVEVPTQEELWASFKTAAGLTTLGTLAEITEAGAGKPHSDQDNPCACRIICAKLLDANVNAIFALPEWAWLKAYIMTVQSGLPEASSAAWRYAIAAFFLQSEHSAWPASADFSEAGKPEAWGAAYEAAHAVVLPTEPVAEDYVLPTPVKDGFTFVGWYDNAEGTGEAYTVIPAGWSGTLYAIWKQNPTTALENIAVEGKAVKAIINGQLIIIKNGVQYDAQGQVVK